MLITKKFRKKVILDNIELSLENNSINLLIGENGSGKTTLFKILASLLKNDANSVNEYKSSLLIDKDILFTNKTGIENLEYFLDKEELKCANKYIEYFKANEFITNMSKTYSNGMKKIVELIISFSKKGNILLLDEPTNSLDLNNIGLLKKLLKEESNARTIFISSHDKSIFDKNIIDNIYVLKNHKITMLNKDELDFLIYKVKTLKEVDLEDIEIIGKTSDYIYIKINANPELIITKLISFGILEFSPVSLSDSIYLKEII